MQKDRPHHFVRLALGAHFGLCATLWRIWHSSEPSTISGVDCRPGSAGLLEMGPGRWLHTLSRDQAMDAAIQLHQDVCLMTTNLDVLDQYALSLQGTASKMLKLGLASSDFPSAEVAAGALGPRVRRASVQMEAIGLWRPSLDPIMLA